MDLELADRKLSLSVSPIRAAIVHHFQDQSEHTVKPTCPTVFISILDTRTHTLTHAHTHARTHAHMHARTHTPTPTHTHTPTPTHTHTHTHTGTWTVDTLSGVLEAQPSVIRRHLGFWVGQGVLREHPTDTFTVVEEEQEGARGTGGDACTS